MSYGYGGGGGGGGYPPQGGGGYPPQGGGYPPQGGGYGGAPAGGPGGSYSTPPPNYLVWAILMIFCCWPLAIVSIVFASQVNSKFQSGDYQGAQDASKKAKTWATIALIVGLIWNVGFGIFYFIALANGAAGSGY
jgi:interferon-induced transmembrane protein